MSREKDEEREHRIRMEIIVDTYNAQERAMGWYCSLQDRLSFPFRARCIAERSVSPLQEREEVAVVDMAPADDCMSEMFVQVEWQNRTFGVPLAQLEPLDVDEDTAQIIGDWHYWVERGYRLR